MKISVINQFIFDQPSISVNHSFIKNSYVITSIAKISYPFSMWHAFESLSFINFVMVRRLDFNEIVIIFPSFKVFFKNKRRLFVTKSFNF